MIKTVSLKKNSDFVRLYKKGRFYVGKYIVLYVLPNSHQTNRIGITVGKKFGKSVKRNRVRRLIRENYRLFEEFVKDGMDLLFVARPADTMPSFYDIRNEMKFLLKKLEVFDQEKWDCSRNS